MSAADSRPLQIDIDRLQRRLDALAEIGAVVGPNGERGSSRLALTDADRDGRDLVVTWMRDLGLEIRIDAIGNVFATRPGRDPTLATVMTGSHIDTVRTGGRFDGNLGVLAGLEVLETLATEDLMTDRGVTVAIFTDEEGARFPPDMLGSLVYVGGMALEAALDITAVDDGARLGDELSRIGYAGSQPCPAASFPHRFVELHIEQGPVLERGGVEIGVVEGVQGISWTEVTATGRSAHAGTTPMEMRCDPLLVAARAVALVREITEQVGGIQVGTVGRLEPFPNLVNVVPSTVTFTVDLRNTDDDELRRAEGQLADGLRRLADEEGVAVATRQLARFQPVEFSVEMVERIEGVAADLGYRSQRMPSGAGHDAQMLARVCPSAMIFVPSQDGLSHNIAEFTATADLERGANVLLHTILSEATA